jgi:hypothetical protein
MEVSASEAELLLPGRFSVVSVITGMRWTGQSGCGWLWARRGCEKWSSGAARPEELVDGHGVAEPVVQVGSSCK